MSKLPIEYTRNPKYMGDIRRIFTAYIVHENPKMAKLPKEYARYPKYMNDIQRIFIMRCGNETHKANLVNGES